MIFTQSTTAFPLKSILKPTVPVSPVRDIPSFEETRRQTPAHGSQLNQHGADNDGNVQEGLLIDFDTPIRQPAGTHTNPFDTFNASSAIRDEKAAREREAQERWEREKQTILEQREARRKSMGLCIFLPFVIVEANWAYSEPPRFVRSGGHTTYLERRRSTRRFDNLFQLEFNPPHIVSSRLRKQGRCISPPF